MSGRLQDVHLRGIRTAQPVFSACAAGTLYFVTDEGVTERVNDSKTAWETYSPTTVGGNVTGPGSATTDNALVRWNGISGTSIQNAVVTLSDAGAFVFVAGIRQTFVPSTVTPGINVGSVVSDPSSLANGDLWYNTTSNTLKARINGATVSIGTGIGDVVGPGSATDEGIARFDSTTGKLIQNCVITINDTGTISLPSGVKQTFVPSTTTPGINLGSVAGDPSSLSNGDIWYNSSSNALKARINGVSTALGVATTLAKQRLAFTIDGGGVALTATGLQKYFSCPFTGTITGVRLLGNASGSCVIDIWKDTWANRPPTNSDSIVASAKPTLSSAQFYEDTTLIGWTTSVTAGDLFGIEIESISTLTWLVVELFLQPT